METKKAWVDFNLIKAAVTMKMILDHYGVKGLREVRDELRGPCPIHEANEGARSFTVNPSKNAFHCFSCGSRGNVLDFVAAMEECSVKDAALKLDEWFGITEQAVGERKTAAEESAPTKETSTVSALLAEIETHLTSATQHTTAAEAKFAALKQLLTVR